MKTLFLVTRTRGPAWDTNKPLEAQPEWEPHKVFMNDLAARAFVVLGGPVVDTPDALIVIDAADENEINKVLAGDPWSASGVLETKEIRRWDIRLEATK